ncbi:hypothetical protein L9F63_010500, partial [Diploptera punctata]
ECGLVTQPLQYVDALTAFSPDPLGNSRSTRECGLVTRECGLVTRECGLVTRCSDSLQSRSTREGMECGLGMWAGNPVDALTAFSPDPLENVGWECGWECGLGMEYGLITQPLQEFGLITQPPTVVDALTSLQSRSTRECGLGMWAGNPGQNVGWEWNVMWADNRTTQYVDASDSLRSRSTREWNGMELCRCSDSLQSRSTGEWNGMWAGNGMWADNPTTTYGMECGLVTQHYGNYVDALTAFSPDPLGNSRSTRECGLITQPLQECGLITRPLQEWNGMECGLITQPLQECGLVTRSTENPRSKILVMCLYRYITAVLKACGLK